MKAIERKRLDAHVRTVNRKFRADSCEFAPIGGGTFGIFLRFRAARGVSMIRGVDTKFWSSTLLHGTTEPKGGLTLYLWAKRREKEPASPEDSRTISAQK